MITNQRNACILSPEDEQFARMTSITPLLVVSQTPVPEATHIAEEKNSRTLQALELVCFQYR